MRVLVIALAIILGGAAVASAAAPATLTTLHAIRALTNAEASQHLPVAFEATVTFFRRTPRSLYVQDGNDAIWVGLDKDFSLAPGDRVLVRGITQPSFRPDVETSDVTVLHHGNLPKPELASYSGLVHIQYLCRLVTIHAVIRSADLVSNGATHEVGARIVMLMDGGEVEAWVATDDENALKELLNAEVEVTGVAGGRFDGKMQLTGAILHVSTLANVKILHRASASPWSLPTTPMDLIYSAHQVRDLTQRVRVQGTITYYQPGSAIVLQDGARSLRIITQTYNTLRIGDRADATGFPDLHDGFLTLIRGEIQDSNVQAPITPQLATWDQLASSQSLFDLVSIEGQVVMATREASQDEYVLVSNKQLFSAIYQHPDAIRHLPVPAMKQIPLGSRVRVTGICTQEDSNPFGNEQVPFKIMMRSPDDITVVAGPSWLSIRNLILIVGLLLAVVIVVGARGWFIERTVRRQTAALAYIERRRSRILEDINGSRPLAEIIEEITELVSFKLKGAPCWCQIADGALLGNCPQKLSALRIVQHEISAHSGPPLGNIFAAFDPLTKPRAEESETLYMATRVATLAIETRHLYSDLLRRSEFDLLTDIHNRFSLDKHLDDLIEEARRKASIFGLIYIDLDEFKQINDLYGHQVGDLYLQKVAERMKRQLRGNDTLARLGGDEFAALIKVVRNRAGADEIAQRLEHSFDEPFTIEGYVLRGSASVGIALYPEDGASKDSLLNAADAAMYVAKNTKRQGGTAPDERRNPDK